MNVHGVAAIVTGAASGLGAATARALAAAGARVALLDLNAEAAAAIAREIGGIGLACDVADAGSAEAAVSRAADAHGAARLLVNCAGICPAARVVGRHGPASLDAFSRVVQVNLVGTFNMIRLVAAGTAGLDPLADGERGVIVSTASIAAYEGQIGQAAYAASKAGVVGLTLPVARELAPLGIRVCAIAPGLFETPMVQGLPQDVQDSLGTAVPFPSRLGRPDEYARLVLAILANPMLNGETIRLDGALRMPAR
ncbi:SDR family NAD(P)-dependent oxidoreductase [Methylobacterium iners]|uniref:Oxidoreductase n=1 Tax=Methylobacterium iners TaxID=418707 RepID=A0ABQ4RXK1_9HYPH|nr:SDR family NAD(P)-dependent oxidoreductase [Methylobacterium iners]GJD95570.1 putative oxidoreductase [Methylobacterium iners]